MLFKTTSNNALFLIKENYLIVLQVKSLIEVFNFSTSYTYNEAIKAYAENFINYEYKLNLTAKKFII